jgi:hypothetical protein
MMDEEKYESIKVKPAENGWVVCYMEKSKNEMMPETTYGHNYKYEEKKVVFQQGDSKSNEKALDKALAYMKGLLMKNKKGA